MHLWRTWSALALASGVMAAEPCRIDIVEQGDGWPVPLVELRTTHQVRFVSDNAGRIAFDLPELMGRETWFEVRGHGYEVKADGFGNRGVRLKPEPGRTLRVEVKRTILARRIGRLTGAGLFAESQKLGLEQDWRESGLVGQDSVQNAVHRGRLFWFWGDTTPAKHPLGIFDGTGATTAIAPLPPLVPPLRFPLAYFTDGTGAPRGIAPMPGSGPTWVTGVASVPDASGDPRLVCAYVKIKPPLEAYEWSLAVWDEEKSVFQKLKTIWTKSDAAPKAPPVPEGHPVTWRDAAGKAWLLFGNPFPTLRCPATFEAWQDAKTWERLTPPASLAGSHGETVKPHSGSIAWHPWRQRWVTVFMQAFGKPSAFGELWYAESDAPTGPWGAAVKVLSHDNYTFYNPRLHIESTPAGSPQLSFEGTYTMQFADHPAPTPRHDYNQILYRLDLDDAALKPAQQR
jgi:hypothetical protein